MAHSSALSSISRAIEDPSDKGRGIRFVCVSCTHHVVYEFPSSQAVSEFQQEITKMDHCLKTLKQKAQKGNHTSNDAVRELLVFYQMLNNFQDNFGEAVIPPELLRCASENNKVLSSCGKETVRVPKPNDPQNAPKYKGCRMIQCRPRDRQSLLE